MAAFARPLRAGVYESVGVAMLDQDKSKQQLIEELGEMRQREAQWRSIFANTPVFVTFVDRAGTIQYLNHPAPGHALEDTIGKSVYDFMDPASWEIARECIERVFTTGQAGFYEPIAAGPNGSMSWYETHVGPVKVDDQVVAVTLVSNDITQRKQAEAALRESEERFKLFMDNSPAIAWMKDDQGRYVYANESCGRRIGVRSEDRIGKTDFEFWPEETAELFWKNDQKALSSGQVVEFIEESIKPDGNRSYCRNFKFPFQDSTGRRFVGGVGIDITERKLAEEALQQAHDGLEQRVRERTAELAKANETLDVFRKFAEDSDEGFGMSDFDGRIVYANSTLSRLFGEEQPRDVIGQSIFKYYPKEYKQRRRKELIPALLREGHLHIEQTVLPRHGKPILTRQSTFLIRDEDGTPFRVAVVISDITERKRAEEALRQSHDELQTIYDGMVEGLVITDVETRRFVRVNPSMCRMLGYSEEELLVRSVEDIHPPEDVPDDLQRFQAAAEGRVSINRDRPVLRKDGSVFYADISGHRVFYDERPCLLALFRDITERKQAEEALKKEYRNLKHLLHSSDHERQLIAYEIHDGLAQELAGALMQLQAFDHLKNKTPKEAAKAYEAGLTMLRQGHSETRRLIAGVRPPILDESGIVEAIAHLIHELGRDKGPKIEYHSKVDFDRLDPTLENAIYRIIQEALTNACQHGKSEKISVSVLQRGDHLRIEVRDWGIGFEPMTVPKNHFGLEGIRQRARLLGGKCSIRSKAGKGTSISVELPVVPRDEEG